MNDRCLNCDTVTSNRFCPACGQKTGPRVVSLREVAGTLIDDLLDFDSRFWRSLRPLLFRPGYLTAEFVRGRRVYYTPPFRMYLLASLLFFLIISFDASPGLVTSAEADKVAEQDTTDSDPATEYSPEADYPSDGGTIEITDGRCQINGEVTLPFLSDERAAEVVQTLCDKVVGDNGAAFGKALLNNLPAMMFLFLPVLALVLKLLYPLSGRFYVEHLVFALHYHAFFFIAMSVGVLIGRLPEVIPLAGIVGGVIGISIAIYIPIYLYRAMRHVYGQPRWVTIIKFVLLKAAYFFSLLLTIIVGSLITLIAI